MSSSKRKAPVRLGVPAVKQNARKPVSTSIGQMKAMVSRGGFVAAPKAVVVNGKTEEVGDSEESESDSGSGSSSGGSGGEEVEEEEGDAESGEEEAVVQNTIGSAHAAKTRKHDRQRAIPVPNPSGRDLARVNGHHEDAEMTGAEGVDGDDDDDEAAAGPSFGDLLQARNEQQIDVAAAFEHDANHKPSDNTLARIEAPTGASLGTVLSQALRTNDVVLLESCLQTREVSTIRATIQRLESPLAGVLLEKLAERLHRKPGRAGSLLIWVQWTLVTHGGYLASQADLIKKLAELNRVISQRAKSLNSLLSLKGKLDMLEAQMELRKRMRMPVERGIEGRAEDVVYIEGQESEDEEEPKQIQVNGTSGDDVEMADPADAAEDASVSSEEMPNGILQEGADHEEEEEEGQDEDDSSDEDLIDDEAEETDADSGDEEEVDFDDAESLGDGEDSDEGAPPRKATRTSTLTTKRR